MLCDFNILTTIIWPIFSNLTINESLCVEFTRVKD